MLEVNLDQIGRNQASLWHRVTLLSQKPKPKNRSYLIHLYIDVMTHLKSNISPSCIQDFGSQIAVASTGLSVFISWSVSLFPTVALIYLLPTCSFDNIHFCIFEVSTVGTTFWIFIILPLKSEFIHLLIFFFLRHNLMQPILALNLLCRQEWS